MDRKAVGQLVREGKRECVRPAGRGEGESREGRSRGKGRQGAAMADEASSARDHWCCRSSGWSVGCNVGDDCGDAFSLLSGVGRG